MSHAASAPSRIAPAWVEPGVVAGFAQSPPNPRLIDYARRRRRAWIATRVLDIGCGAGRNAVPLAGDGFDVVGLDLSRPMLNAAAARDAGGRLNIAEAAMDHLPIRSGSIDLIIAHGIWNLARSGAEFRRAIAEAARVAAQDARLFVFTFSRRTLPPEAAPLDGETFVFTQFSGEPQVFLTCEQLHDELGRAGFAVDPECPLRELNLAPPGQPRIGGPPAIYEAAFRYTGE